MSYLSDVLYTGTMFFLLSTLSCCQFHFFTCYCQMVLENNDSVRLSYKKKIESFIFIRLTLFSYSSVATEDSSCLYFSCRVSCMAHDIFWLVALPRILCSLWHYMTCDRSLEHPNFIKSLFSVLVFSHCTPKLWKSVIHVFHARWICS